MSSTVRSLSVYLCVLVLISLALDNAVRAMYIERRSEAGSPLNSAADNSLEVPPEIQGSDAVEKSSVLDMLMSLLRPPQRRSQDDSLKRGKQYKAKPCYWSLVSCY